MPTYEWDEANGRYRTTSGRYVPAREIRKALDATLDGLKAESNALASRLASGALDVDDWHVAMRALVKQSHAMATMAAVGGRKRVSASTAGTLGARVKAQYGFLNNFRQEIANDAAGSPEAIAARARMYLQGASQTYEAAAIRVAKATGRKEARRLIHSGHPCGDCLSYAAQGWVDIDSIPNPGESCACGGACRCTVIYRDREGDEPSPPKPTPPAPKPPKPKRAAPKPKPPRKPRTPPGIPHTDPALPEHQRHLAYLRDEVHGPEIPKLAGQVRATPDAYRRTMTEKVQGAADAGEFYVRVRDSVLPKILDDGRFKSQFETGTSMGALTTAGRSKVEADLFGSRPATTPKDRPIYGYLAAPNFGTTFDTAFQREVADYGDVAVKLKPRVRDRTTLTLGDSLATADGLAGTPARKMTLDAAPLDRPRWERAHRELHAAKDGPAALRVLEANLSYVEAQFHGGLSVSDIAEVAFDDRQPPEGLRKLLEEKGIPWRVIRPKE